LIGGPTRDRREDAAFASPVTHVHPGAAPILLVHGLEDGLLPPEQSALMHEALQTVGATSEVEWIEGADHVFFGVDPDPIADRSADFLVRHLAYTRPALPSPFSAFCEHSARTEDLRARGLASRQCCEARRVLRHPCP